MLPSTLPPEHRHRAWSWRRARLRIATLCVAGLAGYGCLEPDVHAQAPDPQAARAQQQYELDIAVCNGTGLAAPQREACVREAGQRLDRARGTPAAGAPAASTDGRATVVTDPAGGSALRGSTLQTTPDGRANVVVPAPQPQTTAP